jgi:hypothetical protein
MITKMEILACMMLMSLVRRHTRKHLLLPIRMLGGFLVRTVLLHNI